MNKIQFILLTKFVGYLWRDSPSSSLVRIRSGLLWYRNKNNSEWMSSPDRIRSTARRGVAAHSWNRNTITSTCSTNYLHLQANSWQTISNETETEKNKICRIWGSPSGSHEELYLLGYNAVRSVESQPTFRRNMSASSSGFLQEKRRENSLPYQDSNSDPSAFQPVASRYTDCAILAPTIKIHK
jgi:hypothetical protein